MSNNLVVVDLSHHNPEPDWAKMKAGGIVGVILKATEGTTYPGPSPTPEPAGTVSVDIRAPEGIEVVVYVNGVAYVADLEFHPVP